MPSITPATLALILANVGVYFAETIAPEPLIRIFALWSGSLFEPWQLITYSFLHSPNDELHLFFNMFALYMFGSDIERTVGWRRYLTFYFCSVLTAALSQLLVASLSEGPPYPTVGASGGVFGVLLGAALYFPHRIVLLIIPPIPLPIWLLVTILGLVELYLGVAGTEQGVAHFAHLGGMLGGFLTIQYWRGRFPFRRPGW